MRLRQLTLLRYGKFSDMVLDLPHADADFHFIVGANEAGKSTLRAALQDLLFGMPRSSPFGFAHGQAELRLGAVIEDGDGAQLAFQRSKSSKASLRTPHDEPLAESVLQALLGGAERGFFEQMFCLDHGRLVRGGETILDASKDVGQVLFQSAAGIAGLGRIKDALAEEADKLWAPRKANDRAYYIADTALGLANDELKEATVRTRVWTQAHSAHGAVERRIAEVRARRAELERARASRERVRRLAPNVQALHAKQCERDALGEVLDLPADAAHLLGEGQAALAAASLRLHHCDGDVVRRHDERVAMEYDAALLAAQADIEALDARKHRVSDHSGDLVLRRQEVQQRLATVRAHCIALGWPSDVAQAAAMLPSALARKALARLAASHGTLQLTLANATRACRDKQRDIDTLSAAVAGSGALTISTALRAALLHAHGVRTSAQQQRLLFAAIDSAERVSCDAQQALAPWPWDAPTLRAMHLPSQQRLAALRDARQVLVASVRASDERLAQATAELENARCAVQQFAAASRIVTRHDVQTARQLRDQTWAALKDGTRVLSSGAIALDNAIALADQQVDAQLGSTADAAELLSREQRFERDLLAHGRLARQLQAQHQALLDFDQDWSEHAQRMGLTGMALDDLPAWLARRDTAIAADATLVSQRSAAAEAQQTAEHAASALAAHLQAAGRTGLSDLDLTTLCVTAEQAIRDADTTRERRQSLTQRLAEAERDLYSLQENAATAAQACQAWEQQWAAALAASGFAGRALSVADAEAALELLAKVGAELDEVAKLQRERIVTMEQDLATFRCMAVELAARLAPALAVDTPAAFIASTLSEALQQARAAHARASAADAALFSATQQRDEAALQVEACNARLRPLLAATGSASPAHALPLVTRSDRKRALEGDIEQLRDALTRDADGLDLPAVLAEFAASDLATLTSELAEFDAELANLADELQTLAGERVRSEQAMASIAGQADAAIAAAKRQEALAAMADAIERYLKVHTASALLGWAIAQYRDRKQGPMLARAAGIFTALTRGRYTKLRVDYEPVPPRLAARRSNGQDVEVAGLSEGTRDQLYLALRLAALELHLAQATALPFVGDDLFINFDDARARAGLQALADLSRRTQVIFLSHHDHLLSLVREVVGAQVNVIELVA